MVDPIGGPLAEPSLRALGDRGRYLVIGFVGDIPAVPLNQILLRNRSVLGIDWGIWAMTHPAEQRALLHDLLDMVALGTLDPVRATEYPLDKVAGHSKTSWAAAPWGRSRWFPKLPTNWPGGRRPGCGPAHTLHPHPNPPIHFKYQNQDLATCREKVKRLFSTTSVYFPAATRCVLLGLVWFHEPVPDTWRRPPAGRSREPGS